MRAEIRALNWNLAGRRRVVSSTPRRRTIVAWVLGVVAGATAAVLAAGLLSNASLSGTSLTIAVALSVGALFGALVVVGIAMKRGQRFGPRH